MKKNISLLLVFVCFLTIDAMSWGKTGHRVVGQVAFHHLTPKARKNIQKLLKHEHMNMIGNYMDFVRADDNFDYMAPWHYCTVPDGKKYDEVGAPDNSDAVEQIERIIAELKSKSFSYETELENFKYLVHLVGDIHQPLHVGNGLDKGANDVKVEFFWEKSNLHRVWDSGLIDHQQLSFTEYSNWINHTSKEEVEQWQKDDINVWLEEAVALRTQVYDIPENGKLSWNYNFKNIATVNERLLKAGVRLAGILNEIYG